MWEGFTGVSGTVSGGEKGVTAGKLAEDQVREHIGGLVVVDEAVGWENFSSGNQKLFVYVCYVGEHQNRGKVALKRVVR